MKNEVKMKHTRTAHIYFSYLYVRFFSTRERRGVMKRVRGKGERRVELIPLVCAHSFSLLRVFRPALRCFVPLNSSLSLTLTLRTFLLLFFFF